MRIAFMGKGGGGKTTLTASFTTYFIQCKIERCHTWCKVYYGHDLMTLIDPLFTYKQILASQEPICIV